MIKRHRELSALSKVLVLFLIVVFIVLTFKPVSAHSIHVDVTSQRIELEAYYGDGKPVKNGDVTVSKPNGEVYLTGKTDDSGQFSFEIYDIDVDTLTIEVTQLGHKEEIEVKIASSSLSTNEEGLPVYQRALAGLGYILGLAGLVGLYLSWRMKRDLRLQEEKEVEEAEKQERAEKSTNLSKARKKSKKVKR